MPRKRVPKAQRETPEARALRLAVVEELRVPLSPPMSLKQSLKDAKRDARFRSRAEARGGDAAAYLAAFEREHRKEAAKERPADVDPYEAHRASARRAAEKPKADAPTPPAPVDEVAKARKKRTPKRERAGFAGYIDPRLYDYDDWD